MRRLRVGAVLFFGVAMLTGVAWVGWQLNDEFGDQPPIEVRRDVRLVTEAPAADHTAPSVVGLDAAAARQAFADAGASPGRIATPQRDQVGPPGVVIAQSPSPAARLATGGAVRLDISRAVAMPDLAGLPRLDARERLEALGATVTSESEYRAGAKGEAVLRTVPSAGKPAPDRITLVYAEPESSVALRDLEDESSDCAADDRVMAGTQRAGALVCLAGATGSKLSYDLGGNADRLVTSIGFDDDAPGDARAVVRIEADGRTVAIGRVIPGTAVRLRARLTGADRLTVVVKGSGDEFGDVVLADATVLGSRRAIDALIPSP